MTNHRHEMGSDAFQQVLFLLREGQPVFPADQTLSDLLSRIGEWNILIDELHIQFRNAINHTISISETGLRPASTILIK